MNSLCKDNYLLCCVQLLQGICCLLAPIWQLSAQFEFAEAWNCSTGLLCKLPLVPPLSSLVSWLGNGCALVCFGVCEECGIESGANASLHLNINKHGVPSKMRQMPREPKAKELQATWLPWVKTQELPALSLTLTLPLTWFLAVSPHASRLLRPLMAYKKVLPFFFSVSFFCAELWPKRRRVMQQHFLFCGRTFWSFWPFFLLFIPSNSFIHSLTQSVRQSVNSHYFVACVMS